MFVSGEPASSLATHTRCQSLAQPHLPRHVTSCHPTVNAASTRGVHFVAGRDQLTSETVTTKQEIAFLPDRLFACTGADSPYNPNATKAHCDEPHPRRNPNDLARMINAECRMSAYEILLQISKSVTDLTHQKAAVQHRAIITMKYYAYSIEFIEFHSMCHFDSYKIRFHTHTCIAIFSYVMFLSPHTLRSRCNQTPLWSLLAIGSDAISQKRVSRTVWETTFLSLLSIDWATPQSNTLRKVQGMSTKPGDITGG